MDAKRGYVPEDDRNFSDSSIKILKNASKHIYYLINEGYDLKQASTFVGNHFVLSERQRLALSRSISSDKQLEERFNKEKYSIEGAEVWIDGFNTIITLEVLLSGSNLFEGMDGTIRDLAALRGTYKIIDETRGAVKILFDTLKEQKVRSVHILLDEPVSNSGRLKSLLAEEGEGYPFSLDIEVLKEVDKTLWTKEYVISADAIILDHCKSWFNLNILCIKNRDAKLIRVWDIPSYDLF